MTDHGIGQPLRRVEDERFLSGMGRYLDDLRPSGLTYGAMLYSPHAHARILNVDTNRALQSPDVLSIYTAADLIAAGLGEIVMRATVKNRDETQMAKPSRPILADDKVRFVGDAVAFVVAETKAAARSAVELIDVKYETLPAVIDPCAALEASAPRVWDDVESNLCVDYAAGDPKGVEAAFTAAAHITRLEMLNQRVSAVPLEPRGAIGEFNPETDVFTLTTTTQNLHANRDQLAEVIFKVPLEQIQVRALDVGGGFGTKNSLYPEFPLVLFAARKLGRPVKWVADRSESFLTDNDGRAQWSQVELALDDKNNFIGFRVTSIGDTGAYLTANGATIATLGTVRTIGGHYSIGARYFQSKVAFTHTSPMDAYRGAGRPEATYQIERIIDVAADELGIDRLDLRRQNVLQPKDIPYNNSLGHTFDSGDFPEVLNRALTLSQWEDDVARQVSSDSPLRGIGMCYWIAPTGGPPKEYAGLRFSSDGAVALTVGSQSTGMSHETTLPQLVATWLGIPYTAVTYHQGHTSLSAFGGGHSGSRTLGMAGSAIRVVVDRVIEKAKVIAAHLLEVAPADIRFVGGELVVAGTDRKVSMTEVIQASFDPVRFPGGFDTLLDDEEIYERPWISYPNGCHIAEVEVDPETGEISLVAYYAVEDSGPVVNPMTAEGQVMGGVAQGIGQAVAELVVHGNADGQLMTGSLMDYCLPRAEDLPDMQIRFFEDAPTTNNLLGIKGVGEAGCVGAPPAVVNAVMDALRPYGIRHLDMPLTPEKIWQALYAAGEHRVARKEQSARG
jgi:carbon-monoxide dehydrogenase large subunit